MPFLDLIILNFTLPKNKGKGSIHSMGRGEESSNAETDSTGTRWFCSHLCSLALIAAYILRNTQNKNV